MRRSTKWMLLGSSAGVSAALATAYALIGRPWHLRWGATPEELSRAMPFDDMIHEPNYFSTRAITIDATPDEVWPFLIDTHAMPRGTLIRHMDDRKSVLLAPAEVEAEWTWVVTLEPIEGGRTRVVSRNRARFRHDASAVMRYLVADPEQFFVERRWLLDLEHRAEELAKATKTTAPVATKEEKPVPEFVP